MASSGSILFTTDLWLSRLPAGAKGAEVTTLWGAPKDLPQAHWGKVTSLCYFSPATPPSGATWQSRLDSQDPVSDCVCWKGYVRSWLSQSLPTVLTKKGGWLRKEAFDELSLNPFSIAFNFDILLNPLKTPEQLDCSHFWAEDTEVQGQ